MSTKNDQTKTDFSMRPNNTRRVQIDCSQGGLTDQSFKNDADINVIIERFNKTGILPTIEKKPYFGDVTEIPTLEQAFDIVDAARQEFEKLPAEVRKKMENNPAKLESFLEDEENHNFLKKHGVIVQIPEPTPTPAPEPQTAPEPKS